MPWFLLVCMLKPVLQILMCVKDWVLHYCYATTRHLYDLVISLGLVAANRTHAGPLVLEGGNYLNKGRP